LFPDQELALIDAIDGAISGNVGPAQFGQRGVEVGDVQYTIAVRVPT
jgi:hypothetical protein